MLFLKKNGVRYEVEAVHKLTNAPLWVYVRNDKLKKLLGEENFNELLTETENMELNGWIKSYDCGNLVFGKRYTN